MADQDDNTIVLGSGLGGAGSSYTFSTGAGTDTITLDPSIYSSVGAVGSITVPTITTTGTGLYTTTIPNGGYTISGAGTNTNWSTGTGYYPNNANVHINADGLTMKEGSDIKIGGKSLTEAIDKIEERLGILNPNPELEDRWEKLKELRRQYMELEKDLLEKEKLMKILKEK